MGDMARPMPGGMPGAMPGGQPGGMPQGDPIRDNMSMANPADLALMQKEGGMSRNMSVRDFLSSKGIDVDGPISQLEEFGKKQIQNSTMMGKAKSIGPSPGGAPGAPPPAAPPGGMEQLLQGV